MLGRLAAVLVAAGLVLALAPPTSAAGPLWQSHETADFTLTAEEYCGFPVEIHATIAVNALPMRDAGFEEVVGMQTGHASYVITSPATGKSVLEQSSGPITQKLISWSLEKDEWVQELHFAGLSQVKLPNGGVLLKDAGHVAFLQVWDATGTVLRSTTPIFEAGQHPGYGDRYCEVVTSVLM
jgi:hypothetical protein